MASGKGSVVSQVEKIAQPIADRFGLELWDIEYVKEGASWFLRFFIDKKGGVTIDDCEAFSKAIDGPLDEADPIDRQYYLEVSSPGIERELKKEAHYQATLGQMIKIKFIRPLESGEKELEGRLISYEGGVVTIDCGNGPISFKRSDTAHVRLSDTENPV